MKRLLRLDICLASCLALCLAFTGGLASRGLCGQVGGAPETPAKQPAKQPAKRTGDAASKRPKTTRKARTAQAGVSEAEALLGKRKLTRQDMASPFSATADYGPPAPERAEEDNATTRLDFDPAPKKGPFAKQQNDSPITLRFGSDKVVDPITGLEVNPKSDAAKNRDPAKSEIKGALEKVGGKAEVQVDIFKF
ncbi:hypothetical protein SAMN04488503_2053 [Humidesulfovibrio mexicanus]|uniref:Uncharacterized protein n=1 Tax=Humidesulfovibrio mexicanus TaxID=147047 RepID=A0A239AM37_9BACT|nr:hypothetical protein [Humidesulfovibrio mexicanus]SNR96114.1 hypothetical protein SAMN04488503_2053 [Humidesulfovibrio mexicanus]